MGELDSPANFSKNNMGYTSKYAQNQLGLISNNTDADSDSDSYSGKKKASKSKTNVKSKLKSKKKTIYPKRNVQSDAADVPRLMAKKRKPTNPNNPNY